MPYLASLGRHKLLAVAAALTLIGLALLLWPAIASRGAGSSEESIVLPPAAAGESLDAEPPAPELPTPTAGAVPVVVYISGAVRRPDVYQLPAAARVKDAVLAAGGLAEDADADTINLAEHITDAQHIHIPRQGETTAASTGDASTPDSTAALLNINTASTAELETLKGIGKALAQRIVDYRAENGPFQTVEDLRNVKGISAGVFDAIEPLITVGP